MLISLTRSLLDDMEERISFEDVLSVPFELKNSVNCIVDPALFRISFPPHLP